MTMASARDLVEDLAPHLGADWRFRRVEEDPGTWGFVMYEAQTARVLVTTHHTGQYVEISRKARAPYTAESVHAAELFVYLEGARPSWAVGVEDALRYIDQHLDDVLCVTATDQAWEEFRADARALLKATMADGHTRL